MGDFSCLLVSLLVGLDEGEVVVVCYELCSVVCSFVGGDDCGVVIYVDGWGVLDCVKCCFCCEGDSFFGKFVVDYFV